MSKYIIGIIGGTGPMGQWFKQFFTDLGHFVLIAGRKTSLTYHELVKKSDVIILSVPMDAAIQISKDIGPLLNEDQLLMDICSLKEPIFDAMNRSTVANVIGTHPLFGQYTHSIQDQNVILCPGNGTRWIGWIENELEENGAKVTIMDPALHDKHMAVVQALTHFLTICLGKTLQNLGLFPDQVLPSSTPIFRLKLDLVGRLFAQDLNLYKNLIGKNKYAPEVLNAFLSVVAQGKESLLSTKDERALDFLADIRDFLGNFCQEGLDESNDLFNTLSESP